MRRSRLVIYKHALKNAVIPLITFAGLPRDRLTWHGFALNVTTDLSHFDFIVPCGLAGKPVTSLARELARDVGMESVVHAVARQFGSVFHSQMLWSESLPAVAESR